MLANWFNQTDSADLLRRLEGLAPDGRPRWGKMTAPALLCHLTDPVRVALGEKQAAQLKGPLSLPGISHLIVWILPWPKSAPTAPEFLPGRGMTSPTGFQEDRGTLLAALRRFSDAPPDQPLAPSPVFGRLSHRGWGRLMWRHLDHHLRQFGL